MKTYKVTDILFSSGLFLDEEYEAEDESDAMEQVMMEIMDNIGNYFDIELEEVYEEDEDDEEESEVIDTNGQKENNSKEA